MSASTSQPSYTTTTTNAGDHQQPTNVEQRSGYTSQEQAREEADKPAFPGPGSDASAGEKPKPHDSKILNKLDPRFDADMIEAKEKGELGRV